jgi:hypothetical protein
MSDSINPTHYRAHQSGVECIQITEHMGFCLGNAVKYIWRAGLKSDDAVQDLQKAAWYIDREIARLKKQVEDMAFMDKANALQTPDIVASGMAEYIDSEKYFVTIEEEEAWASLKPDTWGAPDFGQKACPHDKWYYYQSTHTKNCQECGKIEIWHGGS